MAQIYNFHTRFEGYAPGSQGFRLPAPTIDPMVLERQAIDELQGHLHNLQIDHKKQTNRQRWLYRKLTDAEMARQEGGASDKKLRMGVCKAARDIRAAEKQIQEIVERINHVSAEAFHREQHWQWLMMQEPVLRQTFPPGCPIPPLMVLSETGWTMAPPPPMLMPMPPVYPPYQDAVPTPGVEPWGVGWGQVDSYQDGSGNPAFRGQAPEATGALDLEISSRGAEKVESPELPWEYVEEHDSSCEDKLANNGWARGRRLSLPLVKFIWPDN